MIEAIEEKKSNPPHKVLTEGTNSGLTLFMTMEDIIRTRLAQGLQNPTMKVVNQSGLHKGHAGDNGSGESHFLVEVVSDSFSGLSRVARQRMVYDLLQEELKGRLHALSLRTFTYAEYSE